MNLQEILPILAQLAEAEIERRMNATGKSRDEILAEAGRQWEANKADAEALLSEGHEVESRQPPTITELEDLLKEDDALVRVLPNGRVVRM